MKSIKLFVCLLLLVSHSVFSLDLPNFSEHEIITLAAYLPFVQAFLATDIHYSVSPRIQCKKCESTLFNHEVFMPYISEKMLKMTLNGVYTIEEMTAVLDELVHLLSNGNVDDMMDFMVKTSNERSLFCVTCGSSTWEHVGSSRSVEDSGAL